MTKRFKADGERWEVTLDHGEEAPGVNAVVFHCISNPQRPYRVAEIGGGEAAGNAEDLSDDRLRELFMSSQVMDYVHDPDAVADQAPPRSRGE